MINKSWCLCFSVGLWLTQPLMAATPLALDVPASREAVVVPGTPEASATPKAPETNTPALGVDAVDEESVDPDDDAFDEDVAAVEDAEVTAAMINNDKSLGEIDKD